MSLRNTATTYGSIAKFFHWTIFILVFFMIIFGFFLEDMPDDWQPVTYNIHKLTGLLVLSLMVLRLLWALTNPKPALPFDTLPWQRVAERLTHGLLYFSLIMMPLVGWIGSSAAGKPPHLGDLSLGLPITADKPFIKLMFTLHEFIAYAIIALVSIHVLAALYHHFIKRDGILLRMMPKRD